MPAIEFALVNCALVYVVCISFFFLKFRGNPYFRKQLIHLRRSKYVKLHCKGGKVRKKNFYFLIDASLICDELYIDKYLNKENG